MTRVIGLIAAFGSVFTMCQGGQAPKGLVHGDRLNVVMTVPGRQWVADCNNMGGEPIEYPSGLRVCEGVDF